MCPRHQSQRICSSLVVIAYACQATDLKLGYLSPEMRRAFRSAPVVATQNGTTYVSGIFQTKEIGRSP